MNLISFYPVKGEVNGSIKTLVKLSDHVQAQSKYKRVLREYTRGQKLVNKSRADRSPLFALEFYRSPYFVESSQTDPTTDLPIVTDGQEFDVVPSVPLLRRPHP
jgi:hypothetical protein